MMMALLLPLPVDAGSPLKTVKAHVDKALEVLGDPTLQGAAGEEAKRRRLWSVADAMFDFEELSRRALGGHWRDLDASQRKDFASVFSRHLGNVYMDRILAYEGEEIVFHQESMLTKTRAEVQSKVISESKEIPVHYRLVMEGGRWRVYDVIIEGVSLVRNYRSQFHKILKTKSPETMLEILRKKVGEP